MIEGGHRGEKSAIYLCLMKSVGEGNEGEREGEIIATGAE